tara:strand:+ start:1119 stop:1817 length:699 start_codon:yes stop_codon:yes gene_type:complete
MNKLWIFGDSFSHGGGCFFEEWKGEVGPTLYEKYLEYYQNYPIIYKSDTDIDGGWAPEAANYLNLKLEQHAIGGNNWDSVRNLLIKKLPSMDINDCIIFSNPYYERRLESSPIDGKMLDVQSYVKSKGDTQWGSHLTSSELRTWIDYTSIYHNGESLEGWERHIKNETKNLSTTLNLLGYKTMCWSMKEHSNNYENIKQHTKGKINDQHWSFKGNKDFFNDIIKPQISGWRK